MPNAVTRRRAESPEVARLRARLAEADETLKAIRRGDADAIAVEGPKGRRIFTLQGADEPYRIMLERMNEGAASLTREGTIVFCNNRFAEMLGQPIEKLLGTAILPFVVDGCRAHFKGMLARGVKADAREELLMQRADRTSIPVLASLKSIPLEKKRGACLVVSDLTHRNQLEESLRESQAKLQLQFERMPIGCVTWDRNFRVQSWNPAAASIFGFTREEAIGRHPYEFLVPNEARPAIDNVFARLSRGDTSAHSINDNFTKDGRIITCKWTNTPVRDERGQFVSILSMVEDITARKATDDTLRRQAALLNLAHDAVIVRDLDGRVAFWNRGARDLYGWTEEEALGKVSHELLQTSFPIPLESINRKILKAREWEGELAHTCKDGRRIVVASRWSLLRDEKGYPSTLLEINRDVTEREKARTALEQERKRFESVLDGLPAMICLLTPNYDVAFANRAFRSEFGESQGRKCYDYCFGKTAPCEFCESFQVLKTGVPHDWEVRKDGKYIHAFDCAFTDADGSPLVLEMDLDVTEQRVAEEKLRDSSRYVRSLIEASLDPLVTISREGTITDVNEATVNVTGASRTQLVGSDFCDYFTEPHKARDGYQRVFAGDVVRDYPLAIRGANGQITDVLYNANVFRNEKGQVEGVFAAARDITERKRAEAALRESERQFSTLADFVPQFVWMCTPDGLNFYFNQRWFEYTGLSKEQCYGRAWDTPFHPDDKPAAWDAWNHATATGEIYQVESRLRAADGSYRWFLMRGTPLRDDSGNVLRWFGTCTDIDDMKQAEVRLRNLNEELESRVERRTAELIRSNTQLAAMNKELESFNYAVAHDLRAPLRHIHGFSEILAEEAKSLLDESAQHHLHLIRDSVQHMEHLLEDLLSLSRLGRQELSKQVCGLQSLVEEVVNALKPDTKDRDVQWRIGELPFVECDPGLIRQVITNLLTNALKFTRPRPQAIIEIGQMRRDGEPVIFVRDNGVGFSMKYADKLFGLFQRLHRQQDFEGTGVGLAIVQRILHKHGGRVWAEAELNKGATFYFKLQNSANPTEAVGAIPQIADSHKEES